MKMIQLPHLSGSQKSAEKTLNRKYLAVTRYSTAVCLLFLATGFFNSALATTIEPISVKEHGKRISTLARNTHHSASTKRTMKASIAAANSLPIVSASAPVPSPDTNGQTGEAILLALTTATASEGSGDNSELFKNSESATLSWVSVNEVFEPVSSATGTVYTSSVSAVPVPAAVWLFGSGLIGLLVVARNRKHNIS